MTVAVDIGSRTVKVATEDGVTTIPAPPGGPRAGLRAARPPPRAAAAAWPCPSRG